MKVLEQISLKPYNTFGIDAKARYFCQVHSPEDIIELLNNEQFRSMPILVLGGGSNILLLNDFDGLVIKNDIKGKRIVKEDDDHVWIQAGAGELWHELVMYCVNYGLGGIENLSLIPGTVGAAPIQNIGAYGVELKDVFESLEAVELSTLKLREIGAEKCRFGYRNSVFKQEWKGSYIIASVTLRLDKKPRINIRYGTLSSTLEKMGVDKEHADIKSVSEAVIKIRTEKLPDPFQINNSGSFFKNPEISEKQYRELQSNFSDLPGYPTTDGKMKIPAGWLIEQCDWKGKRVGNTGTYKNQALVLVNYGGATGEEIYTLSEEIQKSVKDKFGIELEREVNVIGGHYEND